MTTAIYCRVACHNDDSIAAQKHEMLRFAEQNGYCDCVCYLDNGQNGLTRGRPGFTALMADIDSGGIGCVIVKNISRVCRDYLEFVKWMNAVSSKDIRFITVNDAFAVSNSLVGGRVPQIQDLLQVEMKKARSEKIKAGIAHAKRRKAIRLD